MLNDVFIDHGLTAMSTTTEDTQICEFAMHVELGRHCTSILAALHSGLTLQSTEEALAEESERLLHALDEWAKRASAAYFQGTDLASITTKWFTCELLLCIHSRIATIPEASHTRKACEQRIAKAADEMLGMLVSKDPATASSEP